VNSSNSESHRCGNVDSCAKVKRTPPCPFLKCNGIPVTYLYTVETQISKAAKDSLKRAAQYMKRSRIIYLLAAMIVIVLGLSSRRYSRALPEFLAAYAGDTLWALTAFLAIGILFPRWSSRRVFISALLFSFSIEVSQLYHSAFVDQARHTTLGGLILGDTFVWSDLFCYLVGVFLGYALESNAFQMIKPAPMSPK
jgi:hypothetical protein